VSRVLETKPDVMFIGGASEPTGLVVKQARELGFKGGFIVIDQAKMDEMAKVIGGCRCWKAPSACCRWWLTRPRHQGLRGALPQAERSGRDPSSEVSLNYSSLHMRWSTMKLAGTASDAAAIRAKLDKAFKALPDAINPTTSTAWTTRAARCSTP
jgi:branched-chain amino acid transport system substrate-binding protein